MVANERGATTYKFIFEITSPGYFLFGALGPATVVSLFYGAFVYRLGHQVFILRRGVRFSYALPS